MLANNQKHATARPMRLGDSAGCSIDGTLAIGWQDDVETAEVRICPQSLFSVKKHTPYLELATLHHTVPNPTVRCVGSGRHLPG